MIARIANSLFWMGRYLERAQHTARYMHVHYFSALDAPALSRNEFVLNSMGTMTGLSLEYKDNELNVLDEELIYKVTLDGSNPVSILTAVFNARENARGARDILSSELWESINKFYHAVNTYTDKKLGEAQVLSFTEMVVEHCAIVNGYIDNSLLHDDTWSLIQLGIHLEAAGQLTRILISKITDIKKFKKLQAGAELETYQCITLLKSVEAFDMSKIHYKAVPNLKDTLEFLILNKKFPRSILFNVQELNKSLNNIKIIKGEEKGSPEFFAGKMHANFSFMTVEDIEVDILHFLDATLSDVYELGRLIELKMY